MTARIIMPRTLATRAPYGSLLKPPRIDRSAQRKQFRASGPETDPAYLALIRQCPCMRCGLDPAGIAAHVRMNSAALGKRQALGQKPADCWTLPLCRGCHTDDHDSQHKLGEDEFWRRLGLPPLRVCVDIQKVAGDLVAMRAKVLWWIGQRETAL